MVFSKGFYLSLIKHLAPAASLQEIQRIEECVELHQEQNLDYGKLHRSPEIVIWKGVNKEKNGEESSRLKDPLKPLQFFECSGLNYRV